CIDADELAVDVDERTTAVPRVDGRICLDVHERTVGLCLPRDSADHAHGHGILETVWAAEREHELTLVKRVGVGDGEGRKPGYVNRKQSQIDLRSNPDQSRLHDARTGARRLEPPV